MSGCSWILTHVLNSTLMASVIIDIWYDQHLWRSQRTLASGVSPEKSQKSNWNFFFAAPQLCDMCQMKGKHNVFQNNDWLHTMVMCQSAGNTNYALFVQLCIFIDYGIPHEVSSQMTFYRIWWSFYTVPLVPFVPLVPLVPLTLLVPLLWNLSSILWKQLNIIINISHKQQLVERIDHGFSHPWSEGFRQKNIKVGDLRWKILWKNNCWYVFSLLRKN